jgi:hypothetical protein
MSDSYNYRVISGMVTSSTCSLDPPPLAEEYTAMRDERCAFGGADTVAVSGGEADLSVGGMRVLEEVESMAGVGGGYRKSYVWFLRRSVLPLPAILCCHRS